MKLTPKLTLVFVLYASALLAVVTWLAYDSAKETLRSATGSELQSTAIEKQAALNDWVAEKRMDISTLASAPTIVESAQALLAASAGSPEALAARDRFALEIQPRVDGGEFSVVMLLDPSSGQVIAATDPAEVGKFKENRPFFLNGRNGSYVQSVYYSISLQGPAMTAAAPLRSTDGRLLGVLAGRLNLEDMNAILNRRAGLWQTEEAFLVNTSNLFVTQPRLTRDPAVLRQGIYSEAVTRCQSQTSGTLSALDYRGIPALIVYRWLSEHKLCLVVKIDQAEALAPAYEFGRSVIVISAIALLGAIALGVLFSRGITRPIRAMQSVVIRFGEGDREMRLPERGQDELGDLTREFNRMAASLVEKDARLYEYATELERKVEARTTEIKQREERYRSYIEVTGQIGWTTNPKGEVEEHMSSWRKYTGQSEEEVKGWGWSKALHPDDYELAVQAWKHAVDERKNYEVEYRLRRYDGVYRYFLARGVPISNEDGDIQEWVGTCIDITERKQVEDALRRFELLSEHSRDIILFMRHDDGRILEANTAATLAYGYSRVEILALTIQDLRAPHTRSLTGKQMVQADAGGILFETVHLRKDGSTFPVEVSSQGADIGGVRMLVSIVRDISERKQAEEEIAILSKFPTENPNPVLRIQHDGRVSYANEASRNLMEMWGCQIDEYLPEEWKERIAEAVNSEANKTIDIPCNGVVYSIMVAPISGGGYVNLYGRDITGRIQAEQALFESEEKYRLITDNANDWIYWIKPDGKFRYVSPSCERITGFTHLEFMTNPPLFHEIVHPEDRERVETHMEVVHNESESEFLEYRIITKAGDERWISHSCAPLYSTDGKYIGRRGTNSDITDRKQTEEALQQSEQRLKRAQEIAHLGSWELDLVNNHLTWSDEAYRIFGFQPQEFAATYEAFLDAVHPDDRIMVDEAYTRSIREGRDTYEIEHRVVKRSSGEVRIVHEKCDHFRDQGGQIIRSVGMVHDITERVQAEEALRESESFVKTVLDNLPVGIAVNSIEPAVAFTYMNENFPKFYRTTRENLADPDAFWNAIYEDPEFREEVKKRVLGDIASGDPERMYWVDVPITRKGEETAFVTARNIPIIGKSLMISTVWEVTERKQAEEELHRTLDELKHSNAELEQFAYVTSHDLQEPLRGIAGLAQLLQQRYLGQLDNRADEYINLIVDGTQRMQTLINDLLAYSRIGRRGEAIQPSDAGVALQAAIQNLNVAIREYGAKITSDTLPMVKADTTQLTQLFQNLIGNAIKFRAERPPQIHVGVTEAGDCWQFSVRDNGIGIEPQYFERIFQVFQRLHTRREYKGTGIGLAICKKIIERHGGRIWVESEPGQGTTFYFTLPKGN